jgi:hypothetical protein
VHDVSGTSVAHIYTLCTKTVHKSTFTNMAKMQNFDVVFNKYVRQTESIPSFRRGDTTTTTAAAARILRSRGTGFMSSSWNFMFH